MPIQCGDDRTHERPGLTDRRGGGAKAGGVVGTPFEVKPVDGPERTPSAAAVHEDKALSLAR